MPGSIYILSLSAAKMADHLIFFHPAAKAFAGLAIELINIITGAIFLMPTAPVKVGNLHTGRPDVIPAGLSSPVKSTC
jgi:hypothetical protein